MQPRRPALPGENVEVGFTPVQPVTGLGSQAEVTNDMPLCATAQLNDGAHRLARLLTLMAQSQYGLHEGVQAVVVVPAKLACKTMYFVQAIYLLATTKSRLGSTLWAPKRASSCIVVPQPSANVTCSTRLHHRSTAAFLLRNRTLRGYTEPPKKVDMRL